MTANKHCFKDGLSLNHQIDRLNPFPEETVCLLGNFA